MSQLKSNKESKDMKKSAMKKDIREKCKDCFEFYKACNGEIYNYHKHMGDVWICPLYLSRITKKQSVKKLLTHILAHCSFCLAGTGKENCVSPNCAMYKYLKLEAPVSTGAILGEK